MGVRQHRNWILDQVNEGSFQGPYQRHEDGRNRCKKEPMCEIFSLQPLYLPKHIRHCLNQSAVPCMSQLLLQ